METTQRLHYVRRLSVLVVALTFTLMVVGSWVKATGSGLACPDWPKCYGQWLPPFPSAENGLPDQQGNPVYYSQAQILYEWAHRALASILTVPFVALAWFAFRGQEFSRPLRLFPAIAGVILLTQILLGASTVLEGNPAPLTTMHLATATIFFFLVTGTMFYAFLQPMAGSKAPTAKAASPRPNRVLFPGEEP